MEIHTTKTGQRKKVEYRNYSLGKRLWELEQNFSHAARVQDHHAAEFYHREIEKVYRKAGIDECEQRHR